MCMSMHERSRGGERDGQLSLYQLFFFPIDLLECSFFCKERDLVWEEVRDYFFLITLSDCKKQLI